MMNESGKTRKSAIRIIRWIARIWSIISIGFILLMAVGEMIAPTAPLPSALRDIVGMLLFPVLTCTGLVLAWRMEGLGGGITVGSMVAFYAWLGIMDGRLPRGPWFALVAAPGLLFLAVWTMTRTPRQREDAR